MINVSDYVNEKNNLISVTILSNAHPGLILYPFIDKGGLFDVSLNGKTKRSNDKVTFDHFINLLISKDPLARVRCRPDDPAEKDKGSRRKIADLNWGPLRQRLITEGVISVPDPSTETIAKEEAGNGVSREVDTKPFAPINQNNVANNTSDEISEAFERDVAEALARTSLERQQRLKNAPKKPTLITVSTKAYLRNPDVVAEALLRAGGRCESCGALAPFTKASNGQPYLEVHHIQPLADDGEDTVINAISLCPNCHRREHYG